MPYPLPDDINPPDDLCFKVFVPNDPTWVANFKGALAMFGKWFTYERDSEQSGKFAAERWMLSFLKLAQEDCVADPCCPEQVNLGRLSYFYTLRQADDGTPTSFAPDAPETWTGNAGQDSTTQARREAGLCAAITSYVIECLRQALTNAYDAATVATAIAGIVGVFTGQAWLPAVVSAIAGAGVGIDQEVLTDTNAIKKVICCMYDALKGESISYLAFAGAAAGCGFDALSNEGIISNIISSFSGSEDSYRSFVVNLNGNYSIQAQDANGNSCACCDADEVEFSSIQGTIPEPVEGEPNYYTCVAVAGGIDGGGTSGYKVGFDLVNWTEECYSMSDIEVVSGSLTGNAYCNYYECDHTTYHEGGYPYPSPNWGACGTKWYQESNTAFTIKFKLDCC